MRKANRGETLHNPDLVDLKLVNAGKKNKQLESPVPKKGALLRMSAPLPLAHSQKKLNRRRRMARDGCRHPAGGIASVVICPNKAKPSRRPFAPS